jgi:hypothetical protein
MQRTQIMLEPSEHQRARRRAAELGISLAEYIRRLVREDLDGPRPHADVTAIFDLGDSRGSDVASSKDAYVAEALVRRPTRAGTRS